MNTLRSSAHFIKPNCCLKTRTVWRTYSATPSSPAILHRTLPAPHTGEIRVLSLSRPKARNAISLQLLSELRNEIDTLTRQGIKGQTRCLILASEVDGVFCAGADLKQRKTFSPDETTSFLTLLRHTFTALSNLQIPTISAVNGLALGGGLELALPTHLRVFSSLTTVGLPETRLGIIPGAGGTHRLPALIGLGRARDMILTGRRVTGAEAYFLGIADRLVQVHPEEEENEKGVERKKVLAEAVRLAKEICDGAPIAIGAALKAVKEWKDEGVSEDTSYQEVVQTADRNEALRAFAEKRKPDFKGQ